MPSDNPLALSIDRAGLKALVKLVVAEVLADREQCRQALPDGRLAWSEAEAARLLGMAQHQLRDERRRGRIGASQIAGKRIRYTRADLEAYLGSRRTEGGAA